MNDEQESFVYATQDHLNTYIRAADQKASILLTAQLAFLGLSLNALRVVLPNTDAAFRSLAILGGLSGLVGIFLAGWVVYPRTQPPGTNKGFFFWNDILDHPTAADYSKALSELRDEGIRDELTSENYALADIAREKYYYLRWSLRATASMMVLSTLAAGTFLF